MRAQIDRLRTLLEASQRQIGLDDHHFRSALSCALELVGATPLMPLPAEGASRGGPDRFAVPAIDQRQEELIPVTARWIDPQLRKAPLVPSFAPG